MKIGATMRTRPDSGAASQFGATNPSLRELGDQPPDVVRRQRAAGLLIEPLDERVEGRRVGKLVALAERADGLDDKGREPHFAARIQPRRQTGRLAQARQAAGLAEVVQAVEDLALGAAE